MITKDNITYKDCLLDKDIIYLEEHFPKGDKRRGEAMVLLALARQERKKTMHEEYGEPNDKLGKHIVCEECGRCKTCKDCKCSETNEEKKQ